MLRRLLGPALFLTVAALSGKARAEDAQVLFDDGLSDMRAGRFRMGCALIKQSLEIDARPGTLFTLAECYSKAGRYASAVEFYDRYLSVFDAMTPEQKEAQVARAEVSRAERTRLVALVAWLRVSVPEGAPSGIVVTMDGERFPENLFGIVTAADPGGHVFTTRAPDGPLIEQRIDIEPGERRTLILALRMGNPVPPPSSEMKPWPGESEQDVQAKRSLSPWFWLSGGVGAAGLVTGAVTGVMLLNARHTILSDCPGGVPRDQQGRIKCTSDEGPNAARLAQGTLAPITTVALGVGAAGLLTAAVVFFADRGSRSATRTAVPTLDVGPGFATLGVDSVW